jgi:tRNA(Ile2) C34 agmatinyltransferase TiaS
MPQNPAPPACPKCGKPMHFIIVKSGGRKFRCVRCDEVDPLRLADVQALTRSELYPPKSQ